MTTSNLIECKDCGRQVSVRAKVCPHCGVDTPGKKDPTPGERLFATVFTVLVIGGGAWWVVSLFREGESPGEEKSGDAPIGMSESAPATDGSVSSEDVCRAVIGTIMGRDPAIMRIDRTASEAILLSYTRPDDGTRWSYKCRLQDGRALWGNADGRWRTDPADGTITYRVSRGTVTVTDSETGTASFKF
jgi:hypothetical protein